MPLSINPQTNAAGSNAAPNSAAARRAAEEQAAAQQAAAQQAAMQQQATQPGIQQSEGVVFDLSDKALQQVEEADAARSPASASPAQSAAAQPPAAAQTPVRTAQNPAVVLSGAAGRAYGASLNVKPAEEKAAPVFSQQPAPSDPSEEARARAWAIRGMEQGKLLDLVEKLKVTPQADPAEKEVAEHTATQPFVQAAPDRKGAA